MCCDKHFDFALAVKKKSAKCCSAHPVLARDSQPLDMIDCSIGLLRYDCEVIFLSIEADGTAVDIDLADTGG